MQPNNSKRKRRRVYVPVLKLAWVRIDWVRARSGSGRRGWRRIRSASQQRRRRARSVARRAVGRLLPAASPRRGADQRLLGPHLCRLRRPAAPRLALLPHAHHLLGHAGAGARPRSERHALRGGLPARLPAYGQRRRLRARAARVQRLGRQGLARVSPLGRHSGRGVVPLRHEDQRRAARRATRTTRTTRTGGCIVVIDRLDVGRLAAERRHRRPHDGLRRHRPVRRVGAFLSDAQRAAVDQPELSDGQWRAGQLHRHGRRRPAGFRRAVHQVQLARWAAAHDGPRTVALGQDRRHRCRSRSVLRRAARRLSAYATLRRRWQRDRPERRAPLWRGRALPARRGRARPRGAQPGERRPHRPRL